LLCARNAALCSTTPSTAWRSVVLIRVARALRWAAEAASDNAQAACHFIRCNNSGLGGARRGAQRSQHVLLGLLVTARPKESPATSDVVSGPPELSNRCPTHDGLGDGHCTSWLTGPLEIRGWIGSCLTLGSRAIQSWFQAEEQRNACNTSASASGSVAELPNLHVSLRAVQAVHSALFCICAARGERFAGTQPLAGTQFHFVFCRMSGSVNVWYVTF
jgi:hypothetical protein